jgi:TonB family protein
MHTPRFRFGLILCACSIAVWTSLLKAEQLIGSAIDANGKRYSASGHSPAARPPWVSDLVDYHFPQYPYADRAQRHQGEGLFRIGVDLKTGSVTKVTVIKSTGFASLDSTCVAAIRKWRWKPGRWKEVDMPIDFTITPRRR